MTAIDLLVRVGLATILGVAIGVERQWRSRMAGLQTGGTAQHGSALFLILGAPTRVAARSSRASGFSVPGSS